MKRVLLVLFVLLLSSASAFAVNEADIDKAASDELATLCETASAEEVAAQLAKLDVSKLDFRPLIYAAALNSDAGVIEALVKAYGLDVLNKPVADEKRTILILAAELNEPAVVKILISMGADVSLKDADGKTALDYALENISLSSDEETLKLLGYEPKPEPKSEESKSEEPKAEELKSEEPKVEEPKAEEPKVEEPKAEEPKAEETKSEESKAEEPKSEEPKVEEPKVEEPKAEEPKVEEPKAEEPKAEETKTEEPKAEEPKAEEPKAEETKTEEPKVEEPEQKSYIKDSDFIKMCAGASYEIIQNAIDNRHANVNAKDYYDATPLIYAAEKNSDVRVIDALAKAGADMNARDKDGKTALMYAAGANSNSEIITALISNGAKANLRDNNRMTAIMHAARNNKAAVVKALIDAGAEELTDKRGWSALFWAAGYTADAEVIGVLLDAGYDTHARDHNMITPLDLANKNSKLINTKDFLRLEQESR